MKDFYKCFPHVRILIFLAVTYGFLAAVEVLGYYMLFVWNETLIGDAPRNYFAVITIAVGYGAVVVIPQILYEVYRSRKMILLLTRKTVPVGKLIGKYAIDFPRYSEFKIFDKENSHRNAISFMLIWIYVSVFLFGFFVLLRVSEVDDTVAVPSLIITAVLWGIGLSIMIRLAGNYLVRKTFWHRVNLTDLNKSDTVLMEENEISLNKKTVFRMRLFIACETVIMIFIMLALYYIVDFVTLITVSGSVAGVGLAVLLYTVLKKYQKPEEDNNILYKF